LHPGFVTSVLLPEDVRSVVLGDPAAFKGEHSESEPRWVFFKPANSNRNTTNALITGISGRQFPLTLASDGASGAAPAVDYVLEYKAPASVLIPAASPISAGDAGIVSPQVLPALTPPCQNGSDGITGAVGPADGLVWYGQQLRVAITVAEQAGQDMIVGFRVLNRSPQLVELLPPQVELSGVAGRRHRPTLSQTVAVKNYRLQSRRLTPGASIDGTVAFERPAFKQSGQQLLLEVAQAARVDQPVLTPIVFIAPDKGDRQ
jgi:hypothetical protein